jgi:anti-sigma-K factor RskA
MIDEHTEELAALYVLDLLDPEESRRFQEVLRGDAELQKLVDRLQSSAGSLVHTVPPVNPPPAVKARLLAEIQGEKKIVPLPPRRSLLPTLAPWALAAGFAIAALVLFTDNQHLKKENADLADRDNLAEVRVATLTSMIKDAPNSVASVAWDGEKQRGILKVSNMPALSDDQDYQLWVVDPDYEHPVNGGVFQVEKGTARAEFAPDQHVTQATKFAISIEKKGGVPVAKGPIVMLGQ